jgi:pimeloyl-ACP methyl ester carboxylesterase
MQTNGYAEVNGARLYYEIKGEGETVTLLHSGFTDLRLWDDQFELFSKYFKVIRYDLRGYGRSDRPSQSFSNVEDLKELLNYLGIDSTNLIGVSMGGCTAIEFTLQYPDMVKSLVLSGPSLNDFKFDIDKETKQRSMAGISIAKKDNDFDKSVEFMLNDPMWRQGNTKAHERLKKMFMDTSLEWALEDIVEAASPPASERLYEITKRTLLIVGSEDSKPIYAIAKALESNISMLQKIIINNTGHLPNLDKPEEFNKIVLDFLLK